MKERELGKVAELEFKTQAIREGLCVCVPVIDTRGYDYIIESDSGEFIKIQVKSTTRLDVGRTSISYRVGTGVGTRSDKLYKKGSYDYMAIYLHYERMFYLIPFKEVSLNIRLSPYSKVSKYNKYIDAWDLLKM